MTMNKRKPPAQSQACEPVACHPEDACEICGGPNIKPWFAPSPIWNKVADNYSIICPQCFVKLAVAAGIDVVWRLAPEDYTGPNDDPERSMAVPDIGGRRQSDSLKLGVVDSATLPDRLSAATHPPAPSPASAQLEHALSLGDQLADWCNIAGPALKAIMDAYERRIRTDCTPEQLEKRPWECAEWIQARDALKAKPVAVVEITRTASGGGSAQRALVEAGKECYERLKLHSPCNGKIYKGCSMCDAIIAYTAALDAAGRGEG